MFEFFFCSPQVQQLMNPCFPLHQKILVTCVFRVKIHEFNKFAAHRSTWTFFSQTCQSCAISLTKKEKPVTSVFSVKIHEFNKFASHRSTLDFFSSQTRQLCTISLTKKEKPGIMTDQNFANCYLNLDIQQDGQKY